MRICFVTRPESPETTALRKGGSDRLGRLALIIIVLVAALLRVWNAATARPLMIERLEYVPAALTISWDHMPVRIAQHGALPAYFVRLSGLLFGDSDLGFRLSSVIAGTATVVLMYLVARRWWGPLAGLTAAALLAFERYHVRVSARAIDLPFDLFFVALAIYCVSRFLAADADDARSAGRWLIAAGAASALGFLCKEFTALMLPVIFISVLLLKRHRLFRRPALWLSAAVFVLVISPDVHASLTTTQADRDALFARQQEVWQQRGVSFHDMEAIADGYFMSYADQLSRFRSFGFNPEVLYFYFGDLLDSLGIPHGNSFQEFPYMNPWLAGVLWIGVIVAARRRKDPLTVFLLTMFVVMLIPFLLVRLGEARGAFPTDEQALWYWVDRTMLAAALLTSRLVPAVLRRVQGKAGAALPNGHRV